LDRERSPEVTAPRRFRSTLEVGARASGPKFYRRLRGIAGERHRGARHYFDCGGVILALVDVSQGGLAPTPGPKSVFLAVDDVEDVHARAEQLGVLAPYQVHGEPAGEVVERPWGERSFYVVDPWGNDLCFCQDGTLYT